MGQYVMGIDNGGTNTKCVIFHLHGEEIASAGERVPVSEPHKGWVERDMQTIWECNAGLIRKVIKKAGISAKDIVGIGITGYGNGICLVDADGEPVYPAIVSSDSRAGALCQRLREEGVEGQIYPFTYQEFWEAQTAVLMVWMKENKPDVLDQAASVFSIKDYIRMKLTGRRCYELTEATCSGLMDIHSNTFDERIFKALGLEAYQSLMPEHTGIFEISGRVTKEAAAVTGLVEGTPVAGSCYDVNACALGSGIPDDDTLCMVAGTWSINEVLTKELIEGANSIARSFHPDYFIMEESSPTSASNFEWFVENFLEAGRTASDRAAIYEECNRAVDSVRPEDSDVIFIPYLYASSTNPDAEAAFFNLKSVNKREHMLRAVYEGVLFSALLHIKRLKACGRTFSRVKLSGGIARSEVWAQMAADMLQIPVEVSEALELGALGAAMCAAIAAGKYKGLEEASKAMVNIRKVYRPDGERKEIYRKKYERFERALKALDFFYGGEGEI